jgi:hypothetical protein
VRGRGIRRYLELGGQMSRKNGRVPLRALPETTQRALETVTPARAVRFLWRWKFSEERLKSTGWIAPIPTHAPSHCEKVSVIESSLLSDERRVAHEDDSERTRKLNELSLVTRYPKQPSTRPSFDVQFEVALFVVGQAKQDRVPASHHAVDAVGAVRTETNHWSRP